MTVKNEQITLPSGLVGDYETLKQQFYANRITAKDDLEQLRVICKSNYDYSTVGIINAMLCYDNSASDVLCLTPDELENTFQRVLVDYLRKAAEIKGDDALIRLIDDKLNQSDENMLERCRRETAMARCPHSVVW